MASALLSSIPAPAREYSRPEPPPPTGGAAGSLVTREPPPYGRRAGFVPRRLEDYGDGGAFPEIHVAQYPLDMGRPDKGAGGGAPVGGGGKTLALTVNAEGDINYDAVLNQSKNSQKWLQSTHKALVPKVDELNAGNLLKPEEEEIEETARETAAALLARVDKKQAAINPKTLPQQPGQAQYIKYTPADGGPQHASGAQSRIIKMQDMPVDPLEPPKFRHIKVPRGPGSPPVPVMHSPPRPLTVKDQQDWKIPPCVSNWKNSKGYTIPLDKRLAADGRGLQEVAINDQFAKFTESLYIAEQKARSSVEARSKMQRELLAREKERKERELRELALKARMDRIGGVVPGASDRLDGGVPATAAAAPAPPAAGRAEAAAMDVSSDDERERRSSRRDRDRGGDRDRDRDRGGDRERERGGESREEREERRKREEIREERRRERERERRLEAKDAHGFKKSKLTRDRDRDISEKIALGMAKVTGGEAMYDQRLFNQDTGVGPGLGGEESYNIYDKPLFADRSELFKHKGRKDDEVYAGAGAGGGEGGEEVDTKRFKPDKGFTGADYTKGSGEGGAVQFEKDADEADPFGLDAFLSDVRTGKKKGGALDEVGRGGGMRAAGGGSSYDQYAGGSGRKREFVSGKGGR
ncbi:hypothetical protein D9Q98_002016 [Chlorella vulgaris]|uniref:SKI-interacting protein SKIP SNW domain-containing protein n=1 Tax=Chlorella vulgaris TaxID=3077 RepID=A0A9D4Z0I2_CHLVU|nr:hypothetical protein D9Q98_002016 [Chlorella vulgaris]